MPRTRIIRKRKGPTISSSRDPGAMGSTDTGGNDGSRDRVRNRKSRRASDAKSQRKDHSSRPVISSKNYGNPRVIFKPYLSIEEVTKGITEGRMLRGKLRIRPYRQHIAFVEVDGYEKPFILDGEKDRNRALNGADVAIRIHVPSQWKMSQPDDQPRATSANPPLAEAERSERSDDSDLENDMQRLSLGGDGKETTKHDGHHRHSKRSERQKKGHENAENKEEETPSKFHRPSRFPDVLDMPLVGWCKTQLDTIDNLCATGEIVYIFEQPTLYVGSLFAKNQASGKGAAGQSEPPERVTASGLMFRPLDRRVPLIKLNKLPNDMKSGHAVLQSVYSCKIIKWPESSRFPFGEIKECIGEFGDIETETATILQDSGITYDEFPEAVLQAMPATPWKISKEQRAERRDFCKTRVFSIDPATAKDLDDALSIRPLPDGNFEVGVHIADVSHFVAPDTPLDKEALYRSTSVYLVQRVIPMLPARLCEELCSLNPGEERFSFSALWTLSPKGEVLSEWMGPSLIRSCAKLSYDHAQAVIETETPESLRGVELFGESPEDVANDILLLNGIAKELRKERFENGSLELGSVKLVFQLDDMGLPVSVGKYVQREANKLVEEFMLLANRQVAKKISGFAPSNALLRMHPPPGDLKKAQQALAALGLNLKSPNSKDLNGVLSELKASGVDQDVVEVILNLTTMSMKLAKYFCTGMLPLHEWRHYALSATHYTHFTSPIRRYPDLVVHRMLRAALQFEKQKENFEKRGLTGDELLKAAGKARASAQASLPSTMALTKVCDNANDRKVNSRRAQQGSDRVYLCVYLQHHPVETDAIVVSVNHKGLRLYVSLFGEELHIQESSLRTYRYKTTQRGVVLTWTAQSLQGVNDDDASKGVDVMSGHPLHSFLTEQIKVATDTGDSTQDNKQDPPNKKLSSRERRALRRLHLQPEPEAKSGDSENHQAQEPGAGDTREPLQPGMVYSYSMKLERFAKVRVRVQTIANKWPLAMEAVLLLPQEPQIFQGAVAGSSGRRRRRRDRRRRDRKSTTGEHEADEETNRLGVEDNEDVKRNGGNDTNDAGPSRGDSGATESGENIGGLGEKTKRNRNRPRRRRDRKSKEETAAPATEG